MYSQAFAGSWHKYIAPAQVCRGSQNYYWALFTLEAGELAEPASSFADFLRERAAQPAGDGTLRLRAAFAAAAGAARCAGPASRR